MEIRFITPSDDRAALSRIYENSWRSAYKGIVPQDYLDAIPEGRWVKKFDIPGWETMICVEDGKPVGVSSFCKSRFEQFPDCGEIISIYFLPEYTGKGCGKALFGAVTAELEKQGYEELFLWVLEENTNARAFYEHMGFEPANDYLTDNIGGKDLREMRYTYKVKR